MATRENTDDPSATDRTRGDQATESTTRVDRGNAAGPSTTGRSAGPTGLGPTIGGPADNAELARNRQIREKEKADAFAKPPVKVDETPAKVNLNQSPEPATPIAGATGFGPPKGTRPTDEKPRTIKVRATALGYHGDKLQRVGDVFLIRGIEEFSDKWMERVDPQTPTKTSTSNEELKRQHDEAATGTIRAGARDANVLGD